MIGAVDTRFIPDAAICTVRIVVDVINHLAMMRWDPIVLCHRLSGGGHDRS